MSIWKTALSAAVLSVALVPAAHADDFDKLTLLTFSAPVDLPGITLPAGTYRFTLADPESGRRAIRVSDKDGSKTYGMFLSVPNQRATATDKPVVMFKEAAAGSPAAVQVWYYPAEHTGYEFVYPHDQALKIAKATHESVLAQNGNDISRIDENDRPVSSDEALKESSAPHQPVATTPASTTASATQSSSTSSSSSSTAPASTTASSSTSAPSSSTASSSMTTPATPRTSASTTASASDTAPASTTASRTQSTTASRTQSTTAVGTSGTASATPAPAATTNNADTAKPARKHLPRTASPLPLLLLLSGASFVGAFGVRAARQSL